MSTPSPIPSPSTHTDPPFHPLPGLHNLRDVGNYPVHTASSAALKTRPGRLFRGGLLTALEPASRTALRDELGVRTVFDLRSWREIEKVARGGDPLDVPAGREVGEATLQETEERPEPADEKDEMVMLREGVVERDGVRRVWAPVFRNRDYGPAAVEARLRLYAHGGHEGFVQAYEDVLRDGAESFRMVFLHLASSQSSSGATMIHCTAGKDRTGVFVGVLLTLLGVERNVVADEYALTEIGLAPLKPWFMSKDRELYAHPLFQGPEGKEAVARMVAAKKENMLGLLKMLDESFAGVEEYVKSSCWMTSEDIERLRAAMVVTTHSTA